jgi:hypothetical protein
MNITYHKNPLFTTVELDDYEKKEFWYKIKIQEMEELLFDAHFHLKEEYFKIEEAQRAVDPDYYLHEKNNDKTKLDKRCDLLLEHFLEELQSRHVGDCTCVPCSCSKCHAESILGIDTIPLLKKHSAYKIDDAFGKNNEKSISEALDALKNYQPQRTGSWLNSPEKDFLQHLPRWKSEAQDAYEWLLNYKNQYFKDEK